MCHRRGPTRESLRPTPTWLRHIQATARARLWAEGRRAALGLAVGNIGGGIAAVILYHLIVIGQSTLLFVLLVLLACLLFARRIAAPAQSAPIYAIAFSTFIIILGSGLSPTAGGSEETFANRVFHVFVGIAYAVAALAIARQIFQMSNFVKSWNARLRNAILTPPQV